MLQIRKSLYKFHCFIPFILLYVRLSLHFSSPHSISFCYPLSNYINLHSFCVTIFIFNTAFLFFKRFQGVQIVAFYFHKPLWNKQQVAYFGVCVCDTAYIPLSTFVRPNYHLKCTKCYTMTLERVRMLIWTNRLAAIE